MKNSGKLVLSIIAIAVVIGAIILVLKIVNGAFSLLGGMMNTILGIVVILALIAIVIWMFRYASKNRK